LVQLAPLVNESRHLALAAPWPAGLLLDMADKRYDGWCCRLWSGVTYVYCGLWSGVVVRAAFIKLLVESL
jgi:hypothetical protein